MSVVVSHSEVDAFLSCERKHWYAHIDSLQRKKNSDALARGTLGHKALEYFFSARSKGIAYEGALKEMNDFLQSIPGTPGCDYNLLADITRLTNGWVEYFEERIKGWHIIYVEQEFWLNVSDTIQYPFKPDLIIEEDGTICVVDYKFQYDFFTQDDLGILPQLPKYIAALQALGIKAKKGLYAELRYRQMKDMSGSNIFRITPIPLNVQRLRTTWREQITNTQRIAERKALGKERALELAVRTANKGNCKICSFRGLCLSELQGSDGKLIRELEYEPNTYGYTPDEN